MTSILDEIVPKLRRAVGDTKEPYSYADSILVEYIEDAVDGLYLDWRHDYVIDRDNNTIEPDVNKAHQILIAMKAKLDMLESKSDISFRSGSLSVTRKSDDKKRLSKKIDSVINNLKLLEGVMTYGSELTDFANRLENWFYIETL
ncbi:MAG: hypothetical protein ACOCRK_02630 [bacterium]